MLFQEVELETLTNEIFEIVVRLMTDKDRNIILSNINHCAEVTNFICSAILQIDPIMAVPFRLQLEKILKIWNDEFLLSKNSLEPDGNVTLLDTARVASILLGCSINAQMAPKKTKTAKVGFDIRLSHTRLEALNTLSSIMVQSILCFKIFSKHIYNSLSTINDYSDSINLSDLAVKMLQEDLNGLRITSSIGMDVNFIQFYCRSNVTYFPLAIH